MYILIGVIIKTSWPEVLSLARPPPKFPAKIRILTLVPVHKWGDREHDSWGGGGRPRNLAGGNVSGTCAT